MTRRINSIVGVGALVILGLAASPQSARADVIIELGDYTLTPGAFVVLPVALTGSLEGWTISFKYAGGDELWSAHAAFGVVAANGRGVEAGGSGDLFGLPRVGDVGKESTAPGTFTHHFDKLDGFDVAGTGSWTLIIGTDWVGADEPLELSNIQFTLHGVHPIPGPGAMAVLAIAACTGRRRRRLI